MVTGLTREISAVTDGLTWAAGKLDCLADGPLLLADVYDELKMAVDDIGEVLKYSRFYESYIELERTGVAKPIKL
ncbi:hypothetical protein SAMN02910369_02253 [Lachnospiraceae bacterium NE2001]|nr:hypothetical protein SAMN02910369_02253 [Lachnospiraceae bacterium NE2001]